MSKPDGKLLEKDEHNRPVRVVDTRTNTEVKTKTDFREVYRSGDSIIVYDTISKERVHIPAEHARVEKK